MCRHSPRQRALVDKITTCQLVDIFQMLGIVSRCFAYIFPLNTQLPCELDVTAVFYSWATLPVSPGQ